ncbi:MAG TPA: glycosyltransferase [Candidatus Saccharimonadales bacterium]|nr:glycosyltransferase [Candidatus Saccharimonadales bacterium]
MQPSHRTEKVAVVIPCYNEAESIAKVIKRIPKDKLHKQGVETTILVIDNNSTDNTATIAKKAGAVVVHEPQKGKGNALRTGFKSVPPDTDYVVMLDGDDTYNAAEMLRLLEPLKSNFCDVVIGSRLGGKIHKAAMSRLNRFGNQLFTLAVRILYGTKTTDILTGYFAWKKSSLDQLAPHIKSPGFAIEMEMVTKMARLGQYIASVPISYNRRDTQSNLHPFRDGFKILLVLLGNLFWRPKGTETPQQPRKIVFVSDAIYPYMKGGKEKRLYEITKHLAAMGHDVHIYTMHWWDDPRKTKTENGVTLHAISKYYPMYKGDKRTIKEAIMFSLACFKLIRVQFDILDVDHMPFFPVFTTWVVCRLRRRRFFATWHEALSRKEWVNYMQQAGVIASAIERLSTKLPNNIIAASAQTKESLATIHGRENQVQVVASGIDLSMLQKVKPAPVTCDVIYIGRLVKDKNVDALVDAVAIIAKDHPMFECIIIGQGPEREALERKAANLAVDQNITFMDPLPTAMEVYSYMKAAKVFCTPSVREGFGIAVLEALGCGTPVITSDSPGNAARHLIKDGQNGTITSVDSVMIANAILKWTAAEQKPNIASHMPAHDWQNLARQLAEVYTS